MTEKKKKSSLSPEAAKILEQYRNAGKPKTGENGADPAAGDAAAPAKPSAPPPSAAMRRSGTRGK